MRGGWLTGIATVVMLAASTRGGQAEEYYFVMIFGSQSSPKLLRYTHTWATFVKATGEGPDLGTYTLEYNTISWLPQTLAVHVWRLRPEPGVNLDLYQTLDAMYRNRESVTMWGPFVVGKEIYDRSLWVQQIIASGAPNTGRSARRGIC